MTELLDFSNLVLGVVYIVIPLIILIGRKELRDLAVERDRDIPVTAQSLWWSAAFIFCCGVTHLVSMVAHGQAPPYPLTVTIAHVWTALISGTALTIIFTNREKVKEEYLSLMRSPKYSPVYFGNGDDDLDLSQWAVGRFWWTINGESEVIWDKGSMAAFGIKVDSEDTDADRYMIKYADWADMPVDDEELRRLQEIASAGIASLGPYHMVGTYKDPKTNEPFRVLSYGTARKVGNVVKCHGVNVRLPQDTAHQDFVLQDMMGRLRALSVERRLFEESLIREE